MPKVMVLEVSRALPDEDGYPCIGACGYRVRRSPKAQAVIAAGGYLVCPVCSRHLREVDPKLFVQAESQN